MTSGSNAEREDGDGTPCCVFQELERDIDFDGPLHGADGRVPVRRVFPENWSDYAKAVAEAFELAGYRYLPDQNGEFRDGYYPLAMSNLYDTRVSAAIAYLGPTVRQRKNLTILTETQVSELLLEESDPTAVTDPAGLVYRVHGLRVVDASIFPVLPCANTNFPTMMVAEKIADEILHSGH